MAKSKEQKRQEAVLRAQQHYLTHDFVRWLNMSPLGAWWENNTHWAEQWLSETESLLKKARFANVSIVGRINEPNKLNDYSALELIRWVLASRNLLEMATVYIRCLEAHAITVPHPQLHMDIGHWAINAELAIRHYYKDVK